jgi:site-specific recombinase XerD
MDPGELAPLIAEYAAELEKLGYARLTISSLADAARHISTWIRQAGITLSEIDDNLVTRFGAHVCRCGGYRQSDRLSLKYVRCARRFILFLAGRGLVQPLATPVMDPVEPLVADFQQWLKRHRGICESTIKRHGLMVMRLLTALGRDPQTYDHSLIRRTILAEARQCSPSHVKTMITALRGYLRFLAAAGLSRPGLEHAVPSVPYWRLSSLPRYLCSADVERVIASYDPGTARGLRDRAILLLLARLGLRTGDVFRIELDHIDWPSGTLQVCGKGRRTVRLPLPQEVGDAILAYIGGDRPAVQERRLFLRTYAPHRPFADGTVISTIVAFALRRAGIKDPPSTGGNLLRHSAATAMLRGGASLQSVGAVLRHRSLDTTAHYAKVDFGMLSQIAQPWPGEV